LLNYCHVALVEKNWQGSALDTTQEKAFRSAWFNIYNQPTRYLARTLAEKVAGFVTGGQLPVSRALAAATHEAPERTALALGRLADDIKWLAQALATKTPADKILQQLEGRLRYMDYLKTSSSFPETGAAKAAGVATFLDYARGKGTIPQFLHHLEELAAAHAKASANQPRVTITTMFRAKGLEWPLVFVPNCNNGTIPYERKTSLEEERRLLYVAITRARRTLHLYTLAGQPLSPFLEESTAAETLASVAAIQRALSTEPKTWRTEEMVALAVLSQRLCLADYFRSWWDAPPAQRQRLARLALRILDSIDRHGLRQTVGVQHGDEILWQELATQ
jgi:DNA helicase-2/ATP-dependent DNA helicase PcrA